MNRTNPQQANKKPYLPPELQAFQSLKEITLAITCGCEYWGDQTYSFCAYCDTGITGDVPCPGGGPPQGCGPP